jgi:hypothetical protein
MAKLKQPRRTKYFAEISTVVDDDENVGMGMPYIVFANDKRALQKRIARFKGQLPPGACTNVTKFEDVHAKRRRVSGQWKKDAEPSAMPPMQKVIK